jgi:hypothetical protein
MINNYKYKIQWIFKYIKGDEKREFKKILRILGTRSLDKINLLNEDYKIIDSYNSFIQFKNGEPEIETLKYIEKSFDINKGLVYIELVRK